MSYSSHTNNLNLPQYASTDKPTYLGDFNQAMINIDNGYLANKTLAEGAEASANQADAKATTAGTNATNALSVANQANETASSANASATQANQTAGNALSQAQSASAVASTALDKATTNEANITTLNPVVLFENATGANGAVLSESAENFDVIEIEYGRDSLRNSVRVSNPNGKTFACLLNNQTDGVIQFQTRNWSIQGSSVSSVHFVNFNVNANGIYNFNYDTYGYVKLFRIVGYKRIS